MNELLAHPLAQHVQAWAEAEQEIEPPSDQYCPTRDIFDARTDSLRITLIHRGYEDQRADLLHSLISEIGGNSFDHNIGQWKDVPGICFSRDVGVADALIILADRGQGIRTTLQRVLPTLTSDAQALHTAFTERVSGRAPERRGNGLKFVRKAILSDGIDLFFQSGSAQYSITRGQEVWGDAERVLPGCFAILHFSR